MEWWVWSHKKRGMARGLNWEWWSRTIRGLCREGVSEGEFWKTLGISLSRNAVERYIMVRNGGIIRV